MKAKSAKQKGKELERWWLNEILGVYPDAKIQPGSGTGKRKSDVVFGNWSSECKNEKRLRFRRAAEQIRKDAMGYRLESIIWHPPFRPLEDSVAIIPATEFKRLLKIEKDNLGREIILDKYEIKNNLEKAIYYLKKVIKNL